MDDLFFDKFEKTMIILLNKVDKDLLKEKKFKQDKDERKKMAELTMSYLINEQIKDLFEAEGIDSKDDKVKDLQKKALILLHKNLNEYYNIC